MPINDPNLCRACSSRPRNDGPAGLCEVCERAALGGLAGLAEHLLERLTLPRLRQGATTAQAHAAIAMEARDADQVLDLVGSLKEAVLGHQASWKGWTLLWEELGS